MTRSIVRVCCCILFTSACISIKKEDTKTPIELSEKVVNLELALHMPLARAEETLHAQAGSNQYSAMSKTAIEAESLVEEKIKELKEMSASRYKGGEAFKQAAIHYFEYIKSIYTHYKNIGMATSDSARFVEIKRMDTIKAKQQNILTQMQAAQNKFATENGFEIANSK